LSASGGFILLTKKQVPHDVCAELAFLSLTSGSRQYQMVHLLLQSGGIEKIFLSADFSDVFSKKFAISPPIRGFRVGTTQVLSVIVGVTRGAASDTREWCKVC